MELNGPGISLFQGTDLNGFDNLAQIEEEEEAIEEQRRRELELKNMLENAFDDVSFDNEEVSICNGSQDHSPSGHSTFHNNSHHELDLNVLKHTSQNQNRALADLDKNGSENHMDSFNTPLKHSGKNLQMKRGDFSSDSENYSDQCRKKIQNGSLHDIVDASGGGDGEGQAPLHYNHFFQRSPMGDIICNGVPNNNSENILDPQNAHDSSEQLKILYDVRVREVHKLTELIDSMRNEHEIEKKEMKHQLALMLAEKERACISQSQLQSLLVTSKQQADDLLKNIKSLEQTNSELESSKNELLMELDNAKLTIDDLQRKVLIFEKGGRSKCETVQYESNLKSLTEKHEMELLSMRRELDTYIRKYEAVVKENEELKLKISNLNQINDENLAKKSEIINRLSSQIDETQKQCESLMKASTVEDNFRLQTELKILKEEKSFLKSKLESLEKANLRQEEELKQYESLSKISFLNESSSDSKELEGSEMSGKLGAELYRALNGQKVKRQEIKKLQAQLDEKNEEILHLTENDKILKTEISCLREESFKFLTQIKNLETSLSLKEEETTRLQNHIDDLKRKLENPETDFRSRYEELQMENQNLIDKIANLEKEKIETMSNYSEEYMRFHNEGLERVREETEKIYKLEILKKDLEIETFKKEVEEIKNLYVEVYNAKETLLAQVEKEKNCSGRNSGVDVEEVKRLQKELEKSRHRILELDQTLKQQYQQEVEILNLDISRLKLQLEKVKKEKDREVTEKDKISVENELLKSEVEHVTSEKNLLFLNWEKVQKEVEELRKLKENYGEELKELIEKHETELQGISNKYEITIQKLKMELELTLAKSVKSESKYTSPMKQWSGTRNVSTQGSSVTADKSTSPIRPPSFQEASTSPMPDFKKGERRTILKESLSLRDISVMTEPEPVKIPKKEVVEIMEKLGAHHEAEIKSLENKYRTELMKLNKKFQVEVDKAKEVIKTELQKEFTKELEEIEEKHRIEMENRIEEEKKEAVVDLITEWACEVQSLKAANAEAKAEMERMKLKYKAAKSVALQYKTYFKSKAEHMKEEWKRIEDGYEKALKELEKNVHILVDVKEDEVKAKVESITKVYEQKITKMKEKLSKCEHKLKAEKGNESKRKSEGYKGSEEFRKELERLTVPKGNLCEKSSSPRKRSTGLFEEKSNDETESESLTFPFKIVDKLSRHEAGKRQTSRKSSCKEVSSDKERTSR